MSTDFPITPNNVTAKVGPAGYTAGSGTLALAAGDGVKIPTLLPGQWLRVTVVRRAVAYSPLAKLADLTIFKVTAIAGDTLALDPTPLEGSTDRAYIAGDVVECRVTGGHFAQLHAATNALEDALAVLQDDVAAIEVDPAIVRTTTTYADPTWLSVSMSKVTGLNAALAAKADDSGVVHKSGTESITGQKTITGVNGTTVPVIFKGTSDQSADFLDFRGSNDVTYAAVVALAPTRYAIRAGGTAWLQIGSNASNFPTLLSSSNGIMLDTNQLSSGYGNITAYTHVNYGLRISSGASNVQANQDGRLYVETLLATNLGVVIRAFANQSAPLVDIRDSSGATIAGFDGSANLRAKQFQVYSTSLAAPTTVGNVAEFGYFNFNATEGSGTLLLTLNINGAGYAQSKFYMISTAWASSTSWRQLVPISSTGPYEGNDCELDARQDTVLLQLRIRRTSGTTAGTAAISGAVFSRAHAPFTFSGTTASVTPPTEIFLGTQTGGVPGNFAIGGWARIGTSADASIPNGGIAWSLDTANALKCRTPAGTLKTITLT